jgi:hypothetical protein
MIMSYVRGYAAFFAFSHASRDTINHFGPVSAKRLAAAAALRFEETTIIDLSGLSSRVAPQMVC